MNYFNSFLYLINVKMSNESTSLLRFNFQVGFYF